MKSRKRKAPEDMEGPGNLNVDIQWMENRRKEALIAVEADIT